MNERKLDNLLAAALALAFAAFAAGGVLYQRTFDSLARQMEEAPSSSDAYIGLGEPEKADAYGQLYHPVLSAAAVAEHFLSLVAVVCLVWVPVCRWVVSIHRRALRSNPPRAPAY